MIEKFTDAVFGYCFAILDVFCAFLKRTHAAVGFGVPLLIMATVHQFLPRWVEAGIWLFVLAPTALAAITMIAQGVLLARRN